MKWIKSKNNYDENTWTSSCGVYVITDNHVSSAAYGKDYTVSKNNVLFPSKHSTFEYLRDAKAIVIKDLS